jgi:hypothetical protein
MKTKTKPEKNRKRMNEGKINATNTYEGNWSLERKIGMTAILSSLPHSPFNNKTRHS